MDTIAAVATPAGEGGIAIIRMSGDKSKEILSLAFKSKRPPLARRAVYGVVADARADAIDEAIAIYMPAPHSYTREDVVEIQCHGGLHVVRRILERLYELGAIPAQPGEFTKRAFLNGRIDLSQAEAVMSVIKAGSDAALRSANRQLRGGVSRNIQSIADEITDALAGIEAACDFPEEIDEEIERGEVLIQLKKALASLKRAIDPRSARMITRGVSVALVGRPNTGKSSIMNALAGFERAIVSHHAGTTRDAVTATIELGGALINLTDTAGQRQTNDDIERIGVDIAQKAQADADIVVVVLDGSVPLTPEDMAVLSAADERYVIAVNKRDLYAGREPFGAGGWGEFEKAGIKSPRVVSVCATEPAGVDELIAALREMTGRIDPDQDILTVKRHIDLALEAANCLERAISSAESGLPLDLSAVDIQLALQAILSIRGLDASEATIDAIFSRFCVGK
ncbi:MAG: tRNA uridine-5-carboxymethylaminomethyl(34) synthesis GTPase MnmE [Clostridia bacterium]|nr:tRNA uridine-5-carboxymethylaminomethyl(34) synthesis GTPase MnmE [Clostridia bacterium]